MPVKNTFEIKGQKVSAKQFNESESKIPLKVLGTAKKELEDILNAATPQHEISEIFTDKEGVIHVVYSDSCDINFVKERANNSEYIRRELRNRLILL